VGEECRWRETLALIRLHFVVEGQTEEAFVNTVLAPELGTCNVFADARCIETGRRHGRLFRGGLVKYEHLARDLVLWMKQDQNADSWFTTLIDLYSLPQDFPGHAALSAISNPFDRVAHLEHEFGLDISNRLGSIPVSRRLIPYIQVHEFEALLFSESAAFVEAYPDRPQVMRALASIRAEFPTPEDIDDDPLTAPSKRVLALLPDYQKPVAGLLIAQRIGLARMRGECRHFSEWFARLIALDSHAAAP